MRRYVEERPIRLPGEHQAILDRFVEVCRTDDRVSAALVVGSYASGMADAFSDLDLILLASDDACESLLADKRGSLLA